MIIKRNMIVWADLRSGGKHIQSGVRPCLVVSCDVANRHSPIYTVIPGTTKKEQKHIPVHFEVKPDDINGYLKSTTRFLPEQISTISEKQIIQIAGLIENQDILRQIDRMLIRQLAICTIPPA